VDLIHWKRSKMIVAFLFGVVVGAIGTGVLGGRITNWFKAEEPAVALDLKTAETKVDDVVKTLERKL